jgi:hypothetical protein
MINYLKNKDIDRVRWDRCVGNSPRVIPYGFSWYLDIIAPGWDALIDDDYNAVFPLPVFKKFGISYIATPVFLQRLGSFSTDKSQTKKINEFLKYIPDSYKLIDLRAEQSADCEGFMVTEKTNFELDLSGPYDSLWQNFSCRCKKNIEKSGREGPEIVNDVTAVELINLFRNNRGHGLKEIKENDYNRLNNLIDFCIRDNKGRIMGVRSLNKSLIFGRFFLTMPGRITMLFTSNSRESREKRIGYYVLNEIIREFSSTKTVLDFEGSSIPSIAAFMKSFGCTNVPYYRIYRNRLPWPIRMLK